MISKDHIAYYKVSWSVLGSDYIREVRTSSSIAADELLELLMQRKVEREDVVSASVKALPQYDFF